MAEVLGTEWPDPTKLRFSAGACTHNWLNWPAGLLDLSHTDIADQDLEPLLQRIELTPQKEVLHTLDLRGNPQLRSIPSVVCSLPALVDLLVDDAVQVPASLPGSCMQNAPPHERDDHFFLSIPDRDSRASQLSREPTLTTRTRIIRTRSAHT